MKKFLGLITFGFLTACASIPEANKDLQEIYRFQKPVTIHAASGLVVRDGKAYIVADDDVRLFEYTLADQKVNTYTLSPLKLPEDGFLRSKIKPDYESVMSFTVNKQDHLLIVPSGSRATRRKGSLWSLKTKKNRSVDFTALYKELQKALPELNIEGATEQDNFVLLFQRGNGPSRTNAVIYLHKDLFLQEVQQGRVSGKSFARVEEKTLPNYKKNHLTFADAKSFEGKIFFLATAEDGSTPDKNGDTAGTMLGKIGKDGKIHTLAWFSEQKFEGLDLEKKGDSLVVYLTDDNDSPKILSRLMKYVIKDCGCD